MSVKTLRDLLVGPPHPSETATLRGVARDTAQEAQVGPSAEQHDPGNTFVAKMPGDDGTTHPFWETCRNPFPGQGVQEISRALREGRITDPALQRRAHAYLDQYQKLTGEMVYSTRNHVPDHPTEQQYADENTVSPPEANNLRRANPFNNGRNFRWGGARVR